jgi:pectate lyase-like protein
MSGISRRHWAGAMGMGVFALASEQGQANGGPAPERRAELKNVREFGARGDGRADDTAAIQAAVNHADAPYSAANRGTVFFPTGVYKISAPIAFEAAQCNIAFLGAPGAKLLGGFGDALLKRSPNSPFGGVHVIENLMFENNHPAGKGIMLHSCVSGKIVNCNINGAARGIETFNSQSVTIDSCALLGPGSPASIGIVAGNATTVIATDVTGWGTGLRHHNSGLIVHGGRFEVNNIGIQIGVDDKGNVFQSSSFSIQGPSMEANQTAIQVRAGAGGLLSFTAGGGVPMAYGLHLLGIQDSVVAGASVSGSKGFTQAGIAVEGATRLCMLGVSAPNWRIAPGIDVSGFIQTNCRGPKK